MTKFSKSAKWALASTSIAIAAAAIVSPILITQLQSEQNPMIISPDQKLLDPHPYHDQKLGFKVDQYGNLVQALAINPLMNFNDLTNSKLNQKIQILGLSNYQIKIKSAKTSQSTIQLVLIDDVNQTSTPITISDFNWNLKPLHPTIINTKPLVGWNWNVKKWIEQRLPLTFDGTFTTTQQAQLTDLNDQTIKSLINQWEFNTNLPLFNFSQQDWIKWTNLNQNQKDQFQFQFIANPNQSVDLKITFKDDKHIVNWIYDGKQDQWIADPDYSHSWTLTDQDHNWLGTLTMVDEIEAKQYREPYFSNLNLNQALLYLLPWDKISVNNNGKTIAATASELLYWQEHDHDTFSQHLKDLVNFDQSWLDDYFPNLEYRLGYDLITGEDHFSPIAPQPMQFLKADDGKFDPTNKYSNLKIYPYLEVKSKKYRLYDYQTNSSSLPALSAKAFFNVTKLSQVLFGSDYGTNSKIELKLLPGLISQTFASQIKSKQALINAIKQWLDRPTNQIENQIQQLAKTTFKIQTSAINLTNQIGFTTIQNEIQWPKSIFKNWTIDPNYQQPPGTFNALYQTLSVEINQKIHQVRFKNWKFTWQYQSNQNGKYLIPQLKFDRKNKTINFSFKLNFEIPQFGEFILNWNWKDVK